VPNRPVRADAAEYKILPACLETRRGSLEASRATRWIACCFHATHMSPCCWVVRAISIVGHESWYML